MGVDPEKMSTVVLKPGEGIAGWVCEHGEPLVVKDVRRDRRFSSRIDNLPRVFHTVGSVCPHRQRQKQGDRRNRTDQ